MFTAQKLREEQFLSIISQLRQGKTPTIHPLIRSNVKFLLLIVRTKDLELIRYFIANYPPSYYEMTKIIRMIIREAPEHISFIYDLTVYFDSEVLLSLIRSKIDFSPVICKLEIVQLEQLFDMSVQCLRVDILDYLESYYRPSEESLIRMLLKVYGSRIENPYLDYTPTIEWLEKRGARFRSERLDCSKEDSSDSGIVS